MPEDFPVEREDIRVVRLGDPVAEVSDGRTSVGGVSFNFVAEHQAQNAAAALAALDALGLPRLRTRRRRLLPGAGRSASFPAAAC